MEFGVPQKLPDGRRFLKITGCVVQLNGARLQEGMSSPSITVDVPESLHDKISAIDEQVLTKAKESKQEWFGADPWSPLLYSITLSFLSLKTVSLVSE